MTTSSMDITTIAAVATPSGRGGVGVIRVSGPQVKSIVSSMVEVAKKKLLRPRFAYFSKLLDQDRNVLDEALVLFFQGPHSFTGEDVVEFHCHGGPVVLNIVMEAILALGAIAAQPGEFSQRAFLNDKIDLTQAEAIADLIDSGSKSAARSALRSLQGDFSKRVALLTEEIIYLRTFVEAAIDFTDEEINLLEEKQLIERIDSLITTLENTLKEAEQGVILRDGVKLALIGVPNVGKSSLLNLLAGDERAIVTDVAGTTRDVLREHVQIGGVPVHLSDTAGLRISQDAIENEGIKRAVKEVEIADIVILVVELSDYLQKRDALESGADQAAYLNAFLPGHLSLDAVFERTVIVVNKIDQQSIPPKAEIVMGIPTVFMAAKSGDGLNLFRDTILERIGYQTDWGTFSARKRHLEILQRVLTYLEVGKRELFNSLAPELFAEEMKLAQQEIGQITGEFTSDDLLGKIFSTFCIGK